MIILPIDSRIVDAIATGRATTHACQTIASKVIVLDAARSSARVFQNPADVKRTDTDTTIPRDGTTSIRSPRLTSPVLIGGGTTVSPTITGSQEIISPKGPTGSGEVRNTQPFHTSINGNSSENGDPTPTYSKVIGQELSDDSGDGIYSRCRANFRCYAVVTKSSNFKNLGLSAVHISDELGSFSTPAT